jgi:hypothetical protein
MGGRGDLLRGRAAAGRLAWGDAYDALSLADRSSPLAGEDLELLATAAYLLGRVDDCLRALQRAQRFHAERGDHRRAARCAFWLGFHLINQRELAQASGWLARTDRLLEHERECSEHGYLMIPVALRQVVGGDEEGARRTAGRAAAIGRRFADPDLVTLALNLQGGAMVRAGRVDEGLRLLDEAMVRSWPGRCRRRSPATCTAR